MKQENTKKTDKIYTYLKYKAMFIKILQIFGEICLGLLCAIVPYSCGEIFEGYIMKTNVKGMSNYEIFHLDKSIDFAYALAAVVTVELVWLMLKQLYLTLDWHIKKPKFWQNYLSTKKGYVTYRLMKNILVTLATIIGAIIPYTVATNYENYVMHLNIIGQSKMMISHLSKSMYFSYILAAVVTIKLIVVFIQYARMHFSLKFKGNN